MNVGQTATLNSNFTRVYGCLWCIELVGLNINHVRTGQPPCGTIGNMMNRCGWCSLFSELEAVGQASWKSPSPLSTSSWDSVVPKKRQHHTIRCPLDAAVGKLKCSQGFPGYFWWVFNIYLTCNGQVESKYVKMWDQETTEIGQVWCCCPPFSWLLHVVSQSFTFPYLLFYLFSKFSWWCPGYVPIFPAYLPMCNL